MTSDSRRTRRPVSVTMGGPVTMLCVLCIGLLVNVVCVIAQTDDLTSLAQCVTHEECDGVLACIDLKCQNPCPGICNGNTNCEVHNHVPFCACKPGFSGNPFNGCQEQRKCPSTGRPFGKKVYRAERFIKANFFSATVHCLSHGGRLATIESQADNELIKEEIRKTNIRNEQFWTSGTRLPQGPWVWMSSGEPLPDYADWEPGEPNNAGDEQCLEFYEKSNNGYMWNDKNCWEQVFPICEYFQ